MAFLCFNSSNKKVIFPYTLVLHVSFSFLFAYINFEYFDTFIFSSCKEIHDNFFDTSKNYGRTSRQKYEENLYRFKNLEAGKNFLASLSYLETIKDKIKEKVIAEKELTEEEKNMHRREIEQYNKYKKEHPNIIPIVEQVQDAVKVVFGDISLKLEEKRKKQRLSKIISKVKKLLSVFKKKNRNRSFLEKNKEEKQKRENEQSQKEEAKKVENAVTFDNILKIFRGLAESLSNSEYNNMFKNESIIASKIIRPDITMDAEEFKKSYLGFKKEEKYASESEIKKLSKIFPSTIFLESPENKKVGAIMSNYCLATDEICDRRIYSDSCESRIEVDDQGGCGSCWIFAGLQHLEIYHCVHTGKDTIYSKQEILDCSTKDCQTGGSYLTLYETIMKRQRMSDAKNYPYEFQKLKCKTDTPNVWTGSYPAGYTPTFVHRLQINYDIDQWLDFMKRYIVYQGSIFTSILYDDDFRFSSGVTYLCSPKKTPPNHSVLITGWTIKDNVPVWIVRNSWGTWWGEKGYIYVAMKNDKCEKNLDPFTHFAFTPVIGWSDAISEYKVIETHTQQERDIYEKKHTIKRGERSILLCNNQKLLHIKETVVISHKEATSKKLLCEDLKVTQKCENKSSCKIFFPPYMCQKGFDLLLIRYRCIPIPVDYDCGYAKSILPDVQTYMCISLCNDASKNCSPVTKDCLYDQIDKQMCNLQDVIRDAT